MLNITNISILVMKGVKNWMWGVNNHIQVINEDLRILLMNQNMLKQAISLKSILLMISMINGLIRSSLISEDK